MQVPLPRQMHVLHNRNFLLYWVGQLISLTGTWMQAVAQGLIVLKLTHSVFALGVVNFAVMTPALVLSLTGGVAADRWDRRKIMIVTQAALMVFALLTATLLATDHLTFGVMLGVSVLIGIATAYDMPAQQALVPDLVQPHEIPQAIAMNQVIFNGSRLLGPAVAGLALQFFDMASVYYANSLSFIAVIASLWLIKLPPRRVSEGARGSMFSALAEGLGYVRRSRMLVSLFGAMALAVFLMFPAMAVLPAGYVDKVLGRGASTLGLMMAASGGASMVGAFVMLWIPAHRRGQVMAVSALTMAASVAVMALSRNVLSIILVTGLLSLGFSMLFGLIATTVQLTVPGELRGRVMSVSGLTFNGVLPFSALIMSFAAARAGFGPVYLLSAGAFAVLGLTLVLRSGILTFIPPAMPKPSYPHTPATSRTAMPEAAGVGDG